MLAIGLLIIVGLGAGTALTRLRTHPPGPLTGIRLRFGEDLHVGRPDLTPTAQIAGQLALARKSGANTVRIDVPWADLQPTSSAEYSPSYVQRLDEIAKISQSDGLGIIVVFLGSPCWASSAPAGLLASCRPGAEAGADGWAPARDADYAAAAAWLAKRYRPQLAAFEVWNEPDNRGPQSDFYTAQDPAFAYSQLLRATYPAVKAVAPSLPVLGGSFASPDTTFLENMLHDGAAGSFDGLSVHLYGIQQAVQTWSASAELATPGLLGVRSLESLLQAAHAPTAIWVTEIGVTACGSMSSDGCVSTGNALVALRAAIGFLARAPYVRDIEVYELVSGPTTAQAGFGMYATNLAPRPLAGIVSSTLSRLRD